jgi:hypothetical protein
VLGVGDRLFKGVVMLCARSGDMCSKGVMDLGSRIGDGWGKGVMLCSRT